MKLFQKTDNPTSDELFNWLNLRYPSIIEYMNNTSHSMGFGQTNHFHLEGTVNTHTCMVLLMAETLKVSKIVKISALLHDIGKPKSRKIEEFSKNQIEKGLDAKYPKYFLDSLDSTSMFERFSEEYPNIKDMSATEARKFLENLKTQKVMMKGHEGLSFFLSIEVLNELKRINVINVEEMQDILTLISMHGDLFDHIKDFKEFKPEVIINKFNGKRLFLDFVDLVKCDSLGRFHIESDGRKGQAKDIGKSIFNSETWDKYFKPKSIFNNENKPTITLLVGLPETGKRVISTWINKNVTNSVVISRDNMLMEYAKQNGISGNYTEVFKQLTDEERHNIIDKNLNSKFNKAVKENKNILIDMVNSSKRSRKRWLNSKKHHKKCVIFCANANDIKSRLDKRYEETGKFIPPFVNTMFSKSFGMPTYAEFNEIAWNFS